jgi:N-terminal half of MaoC dehydratase
MSPVADTTLEALARFEALIGVPQYEQTGDFPVERGYIWTSCASVENGNPLYWNDDVARALTGGPVAPPSMISVWFRPHHWAPGRRDVLLPLQVHFDLKEMLGLPEAVMTDDAIVFHEPVRVGDVLRTRQILRSVTEEKQTKLGTGRFWVIDVEYENQRGELVGVETYTGFGYRRAAVRDTQVPSGPLGAEPTGDAREDSRDDAGEDSGDDAGAAGRHDAARQARDEAGGRGASPGPGDGSVSREGDSLSPLVMLSEVAEGDRLSRLSYEVTATTVVLGAIASRDWRPMHHDKDFAVLRNGTKDIFLNTPNQAAWFERYLTDWTGPHGRPARMSFLMRGSVFPGDTMVLDGVVDEVGKDATGCGFVGVDVTLSVNGETKTTCDARVAVPVSRGDNPWARRGDDWLP